MVAAPIDHAHPDFIRLDAGCVRNTTGASMPFTAPMAPPAKAWTLNSKIVWRATDHLLGRKHLEDRKKHGLYT